jgi:tripartite-type tricarboxylate transporter receptor subunit TctC
MSFNQKAGLDLQHIPFPGSPPALTQLMGGHVAIMFDGMATSKQMVTGGKLVAYGVAASKRSPHLPDVPTMAEQGYPDINFSNWLGIVVSSNMSNELVDKIHTAMVKVAASPKVRDRMVAAGFEPADDMNVSQLAQSVKTDFDRNAAIVKAFNIQINQ